MATRIISGAVLLPVLLFFIIYGGLPLHIAIAVISVMGLYEFYKVLSGKIKLVHFIGFISGLIYVIFVDSMMKNGQLFSFFISFTIGTLLFYMVLFHKSVEIKDIFVTLFGVFYVPFLLTHIYLVREYKYGNYFVWLIFIAAFGCDTGAYFIGRFFGKHKLIPSLSPKKTVEGAIGGVIVATLLSVVFGLLCGESFAIKGVNTLLMCTIIGAWGSVLSQVGDLAASSFKRYMGVKDYSNLIPGHGGILDRFDSVIVTAPVVYYIMIFLTRTIK
ncbi:MAG: phosphatidate cytidylyltransferase [Clostridia bacterium]|jgi:phosphatidate cytidylyltransferase|nr:phosphatidate cytidylyltransferase [Clostridia bacterium]MCI2000186.1 phosphatidate cytidylyltransferase [Clostridia bacterium]MCI2014649.1 phosphatidate cytidylyltransferase [Clostridia bacterium]